MMHCHIVIYIYLFPSILSLLVLYEPPNSTAMPSSLDFDTTIFSPRPYNKSQRTMFSLGCSCGRAKSPTPLSQRQEDCFSYVVSVDGVHVCHPQDIIENENTGEDDPEKDPQNLVECGSTREGEGETNPETLVKDESIKAAATEQENPGPLLRRRGRLPSALHLSTSVANQSTLINPAGDRVKESNVVDHPRSKTGDYELIKQIGIDGEGVVHLIRSRKTRQLMVRKTVSYARTLFAKPVEAAILEDVFPDRHNNIIHLHAFELYQSFGTEDIGARYYLEYCSRGDLHQLVDQYRNHHSMLPEPFIFKAYQNLASALEFLHRGFDPRCGDPNRWGICHRDIKPSNIFLSLTDSVYPEVVLADFGHSTQRFATYEEAGTRIWQPPELPRHSPRGDVWSLGAVIYFLIHFKPPIARLPKDVPRTPSAKRALESAPEARQPLFKFVDVYS